MKQMPTPTQSELEILQVLWQKGPSTVREVNDRLNEDRSVGYTTTLKTMQIMFDKGLLAREKEKRTHIYEPLIRETEVKDRFIDQLVDEAFKGSAMQLVMHALGRSKATKEEMDAIRQLLDDQNETS